MATMFPSWLHALSILALLLGAACSILLSVQVVRHPQRPARQTV